jgi:tetratricopeptide (TPR) repeat protein
VTDLHQDRKAQADLLIEEAKRISTEGRPMEAADAYFDAATRFDPYASFALVAGDMYREAGAFDKAVAAYRHVVDAVPEHDQAWHYLGWSLVARGDHDEGRSAIVRAQAIARAPDTEQLDALIAEYWESGDPVRRGQIISEVVWSEDDDVTRMLHDHIERARRYGTGIGDLDHWASVAQALVRFGISAHLDLYTDGPAPSREWVLEDVERYLAGHDRAPETLWPITYGPADALPRPRNRRPHGRPWWRRLFGR